jgi:hypothetical protein
MTEDERLAVRLATLDEVTTELKKAITPKEPDYDPYLWNCGVERCIFAVDMLRYKKP